MTLVEVYNKVTGRNVTVKNKTFDDVRMAMKAVRDARTVGDAAFHLEMLVGHRPEDARTIAIQAREVLKT